MAVDPRTPVLVGVGQFTERIDDPSYRGMSAVELATAAAQAALTDTGANAARVAQAIERCSSGCGSSRSARRSEARSAGQLEQLPALGDEPARRPTPRAWCWNPVGGQGPQKLVTEFAGNAIVAGDIDVAMILGSEPGSTTTLLRHPR